MINNRLDIDDLKIGSVLVWNNRHIFLIINIVTRGHDRLYQVLVDDGAIEGWFLDRYIYDTNLNRTLLRVL